MAKPEIMPIGSLAYRWQEICQLRRKSLRNEKLPSHGSLPCSSSRTIAVRRPNGPPPAATPSRPFCGHDHAPRKRGMIANSLPARPTTHCPVHALAMPSVRPRSHVSTRAKIVGRSFRMILSISKPAPAASDFGGLCPHARLVQGRSLPRPTKSRGLVQFRAAARWPCGKTFERAALARGP